MISAQQRPRGVRTHEASADGDSLLPPIPPSPRFLRTSSVGILIFCPPIFQRGGSASALMIKLLESRLAYKQVGTPGEDHEQTEESEDLRSGYYMLDLFGQKTTYIFKWAFMYMKMSRWLQH